MQYDSFCEFCTNQYQQRQVEAVTLGVMNLEWVSKIKVSYSETWKWYEMDGINRALQRSFHYSYC